MPSLLRLRAVSEDLIEIRDSGEISARAAVAKVVTFLRECELDVSVLESLNERGDGTVGDLDYNVDNYQQLQRQGINAYRLKILDLERIGLKYRIIYCHFPQRDCYVVLAVLSRDIAYDPRHPKTQRIIASHQELVDQGWR